MSKFFLAILTYVAMGAVIGWCMLLVMTKGLLGAGLLTVALIVYLYAFWKLGCTGAH